MRYPAEINTQRPPLPAALAEVVEISGLAFPSVWNFLHRCRLRRRKIFSYFFLLAFYFYLTLLSLPLLLLLLLSTGAATINSIQIGNVNMQMRMFFWVKSSATFRPSYFCKSQILDHFFCFQISHFLQVQPSGQCLIKLEVIA